MHKLVFLHSSTQRNSWSNQTFGYFYLLNPQYYKSNYLYVFCFLTTFRCTCMHCVSEYVGSTVRALRVIPELLSTGVRAIAHEHSLRLLLSTGVGAIAHEQSLRLLLNTGVRAIAHEQSLRLLLSTGVRAIAHEHSLRLILRDRKSTRLNSSHSAKSRMPSSA